MKIRDTSRGAVLALALLGICPPAWSDEAGESWEKMVFHVDDSANARWALMLARAYLEDSPKARIAIVSYGPGVDFLLAGAKDARGNPYDPAVSALVAQGVAFRVCETTLKARQIARDEVLTSAAIVPSGLTEIARLQIQEGYAYLKP